MDYMTKCFQCEGKGYTLSEEELKEEERYITGINSEKCVRCRGTGISRHQETKEDAPK